MQDTNQMTRLDPPSSGSLVLIGDCYECSLRMLTSSFTHLGYEVLGSARGDGLLSLARTRAPSLTVLELRLADGDGLEVVGQLRAAHPRMPIVVLTAFGSVATAIQAVRSGANHYVAKPADARQLLAAIGESVEEPRANSKPMTLDRAIWEYINFVRAVAGSVTGAARLLGIDRRSLRRMLAKYAPPETREVA
jgi:two-component system response regulator RegA